MRAIPNGNRLLQRSRADDSNVGCNALAHRVPGKLDGYNRV